MISRSTRAAAIEMVLQLELVGRLRRHASGGYGTRPNSFYAAVLADAPKAIPCHTGRMTPSAVPSMPEVLFPDDLRAAADAFEAALNYMSERTSGPVAHSARRALARHIMEAAFRGERDRDALIDGALAYADAHPQLVLCA